MSIANQSVRTRLDAPLNAALRLYGYLANFCMSFTICRLLFVLNLIPLYLCKIALSATPTVLRNLPYVLTAAGREKLVQDANDYRIAVERRGQVHLQGSFRFPHEDVYRTERNGKELMYYAPWKDNIEEFLVGGAAVRYVHLRPASDSQPNGPRPPIVFLHGNPSWSYIWRNILPGLVQEGHEVFAIDWLGHGHSDKITRPESITFELHMATLIRFFKVTQLKDAMIVAHDWGGCVALCTIPELPPQTCTRLCLLNSFLPPRPSDLTWHYLLLYWIWFLTTGILRGYIPEFGIMMFMSPHMSYRDVEGYGAPFKGLPRAAKSSVFRFGHMVPGMPRSILRDIRDLWPWKLFEGLCGPVHFDNLNEQALLSMRDDTVRLFWNKWSGDEGFKVAIAFGDQDPLLKEYKDMLVQTIDSGVMVNWAPDGVWIPGGGHYPVEEKPREIIDFIKTFATNV